MKLKKAEGYGDCDWQNMEPGDCKVFRARCSLASNIKRKNPQTTWKTRDLKDGRIQLTRIS